MFYSHQLLARKAPLGQIWLILLPSRSSLSIPFVSAAAVFRSPEPRERAPRSVGRRLSVHAPSCERRETGLRIFFIACLATPRIACA
ncbi:hypothetical protein NL676_036955 [Syzygium grande]|nr:hypothetical protein NL676_036955 [Syzygium grande]